jgi:ankyrin repeat protein
MNLDKLFITHFNKYLEIINMIKNKQLSKIFGQHLNYDFKNTELLLSKNFNENIIIIMNRLLQYGHIRQFEQMLSFISQYNNMTPLMYVLENINVLNDVTENIINHILDLKPDINIANQEGLTPLMIALLNKSGKITENVINRILDLKPNIDTSDKEGLHRL